MDSLKDQLCIIFNNIWAEETIPENCSKGIIVVIPKKGDTTICKNNRGIRVRQYFE